MKSDNSSRYYNYVVANERLILVARNLCKNKFIRSTDIFNSRFYFTPYSLPERGHQSRLTYLLGLDL